MVVESLTSALLQLMSKKPLSEINVSELCDRAGVSRVSFYRNFNSMKEILVNNLNQRTDKWWLEISLKNEDEFYQSFWSELLEVYRKNEKLIKLLYANNASHILKEHIFACCAPEKESMEANAYARAALAGAIYGLVDEWIRRGMHDFPNDFSLRHMAEKIPF